MAKAINNIEKGQRTAEEEERIALHDMLNALTKHKESLIMTLEILEELRQSGLLDMLKGLLRTRHKVGRVALDTFNQPESHRLIKNGTQAIKFISQLDPDQLSRFLNSIQQGIEATKQGEQQSKVGMWGLTKTLKDPEVNAAMSMSIQFLRGVGKEWKQPHS